ncbi:RNA polymerase sigma-70 factor [Parabacteroides sp. OttesenSCG-928-K15]|nr:RNA polymerase sigma-70 factor [Parabacteroides sp. OttesenSCG-928-K15]
MPPKVLLRLKQGDESAFDVIYWQYSAWVYHFIHSLLEEKLLAEDLTQSVFLKIWEKREIIDPEGSFDSYLFTIARHLVYKETEKRLLSERFIETIQKRSSDRDTLTEEQIDTESLRQYISSLIDQLPASRREVYRLSRIHHLSNKEIAARLSISEKTVETQIYRSLRFLREKLAKDITFLF